MRCGTGVSCDRIYRERSGRPRAREDCRAMEKEMRRAREIYIMLALQEREEFIIKKETDRVRPILYSMALPERREWLQGPEFARRVERAKNRDRVWQSLVNGELCLTEQADEIDALAPLIVSELKAGRKPELDFLRSVRRFRLSPEQAHRAIDLLNDGTVNGWLTGKKG